MTRRVVVTGAGVVTALGYELADFWERICAGKSGVGTLKRFETTDFKVTFGGEIRDFVPEEHLDLDDKEVRRLDRFVQFAMVAAHKAVQSSGIDLTQGDPYRHGTLIGSGIGGLHEIEEQHSKLYERGPSRVSPFMIPKLIVNAASGNVSIRWKLRGPNSAVATACATGTNAIGDAFRLIQNDCADVMLAGGSEAAITPMCLSGFARMNALSTRNDEPEKASRPFDAERDGFVLSEGAGVVILEEYEHAKSRGATILAEVFGYGMTADANHMTAPDPEGKSAARAMAAAIRDARLDTGRHRLHQRPRDEHATRRQGRDDRRQNGLRPPRRCSWPSPARRASSATCWGPPAELNSSSPSWRCSIRSRRRPSISTIPIPTATSITSPTKPGR